MANEPKFVELTDAIHSGLENMNKWYQKIDDTDAYFICLSQCSQLVDVRCLLCPFSALDPNWKLAYTEEEWNKEAFEAGRKQLVKVVR